MHFLSTVIALLPALTGLITFASAITGGTSGSPSAPWIFFDDGGDDVVGFITTVPVDGMQVPALTMDFTKASNVYLNNSVFMVQPANSTIYMPIQLLSIQGPTPPPPKGMSFAAVMGAQSQGSTGFFVSPANENVFNTNTGSFRSFVHCDSVTVGTSGLPQLFWAAAGTKTPSGCFNTQFVVQTR
ncbi:hypothetical protein M422DRAFT_775917 [Sphaerobolus stellatus SS14]|nr:hypothetical protein M422DRAFT_775917 [Sphaerobolus stellatus SS14]